MKFGIFTYPLQRIWQHKFWFILVLVLQFCFLALVLITQLYYQTHLLVSLGDAMGYMKVLQNPEFELGEDPFANLLGDDPLLILSKFNEIKRIVYKSLLISFIWYLLINSLIWLILIRWYERKSWKQAVRWYGSSWILNLVLFLPLGTFILLLLQNNFFTLIEGTYMRFYGVAISLFFVLTLYFTQVSYVQLTRFKLKQTLIHAFKKGGSEILGYGSVFIVGLVIVGSAGYFLFDTVSVEPPFWKFLLAAILVVLAFVYSKLLFLEVQFSK